MLGLVQNTSCEVLSRHWKQMPKPLHLVPPHVGEQQLHSKYSELLKLSLWVRQAT